MNHHEIPWIFPRIHDKITSIYKKSPGNSSWKLLLTSKQPPYHHKLPLNRHPIPWIHDTISFKVIKNLHDQRESHLSTESFRVPISISVPERRWFDRGLTKLVVDSHVQFRLGNVDAFQLADGCWAQARGAAGGGGDDHFGRFFRGGFMGRWWFHGILREGFMVTLWDFPMVDGWVTWWFNDDLEWFLGGLNCLNHWKLGVN